jgi:hypothetical protein
MTTIPSQHRLSVLNAADDGKDGMKGNDEQLEHEMGNPDGQFIDTKFACT